MRDRGSLPSHRVGSNPRAASGVSSLSTCRQPPSPSFLGSLHYYLPGIDPKENAPRGRVARVRRRERRRLRADRLGGAALAPKREALAPLGACGVPVRPQRKVRWLTLLPGQAGPVRNLGHWLESAADSGEALVLGGDFNVAPEDQDVWNPEVCHAGTHVSP
jgi:hypothetical protein